MSPDAQPPPGRDRAAAQSPACQHDDAVDGSRTVEPAATTSIDSAEVVGALSPMGDTPPATERQARALAPLKADKFVRHRRAQELWRVRWRAEHWKASTATRVRYFAREHDAYAFANRRVHAGFFVVDICRCDASPWEQVAP